MTRKPSILDDAPHASRPPAGTTVLKAGKERRIGVATDYLDNGRGQPFLIFESEDPNINPIRCRTVDVKGEAHTKTGSRTVTICGRSETKFSAAIVTSAELWITT